MVKYINSKDKVSTFFEKEILPQLDEFSQLEYNLTISQISLATNVSKGIVDDYVKALIEIGKLRCVLILSKDEMERVKKLKKEIEEDFKKAGLEKEEIKKDEVGE